MRGVKYRKTPFVCKEVVNGPKAFVRGGAYEYVEESQDEAY